MAATDRPAAMDPATAKRFEIAPLAEGEGASEGEVEIVEVGTEGA